MLQNIRDRAQGWIAAIILGFVSIPFALWGINSYFDAAAEVIVAEVNGEEINLNTYQQAYTQYRQTMQAMMGGAAELLDQETMKKEALDQLVEMTLLRQAAEDAGFRIGDAQVAAQIHALDAFKQDGVFDQKLYEQRLQNSGMSTVAFEEQLRRDMMIEQWRHGVQSTVFVTDHELDWFDRLNSQQRTIAYAVLSSEPVKSSVSVSDEQIAKHYEEHANRYMTDETVVVSYIDMSQDALAATIQIDEDDLREYYEANKANYTVPEERSASHILISVPKDADEETVKAAEAKARDALEQARAGSEFDKIAIETSDDKGTAAEGGDLGYFRKGVMAPEFEEAVFSMEKGEISDIVRSSFGFHIIRLNDIRPEHSKSFEDARAEVEQALRKERAEKMFFDRFDQLLNLAFEHPDSLEPAAEAVGLPAQESKPFSRKDAEGVLADPKVLEVAFNEEMIAQGVNSEPIDLGNNHVVVLRVKEHQPAARKPLEEVRETIREEIIAEMARERTFERGRKLVERLRAGETREALAEGEQLEWKQAEKATRSDPDVSRAILRGAFKLGRPADGKPIYGGVPLGSGDYALVAVLQVEDGDPLAIKEEERKAVREDLLRAKAFSAWTDFVASLRSRASIETWPEKI